MDQKLLELLKDETEALKTLIAKIDCQMKTDSKEIPISFREVNVLMTDPCDEQRSVYR